MQVLVPKPKKEIYRIPDFTVNKFIFKKNAEYAKCTLIHGPKSEKKLQSIFLNEGAIEVNLGDDRITDIMLWNADTPTTFDELFYKLCPNAFEISEQLEIESEPESPSESRTIYDSSMLEDAQRVCDNFRTQWEEYVNQKTETRQKLNYVREENIDRFLNETVPLVAFDIYQMIDSMIKIEGMKESAFGRFKELKAEADLCDDPKERVKIVRKLSVILESKIPATIKYKRPKNIYPVVNAKSSGSADMEQYQSTQGK